MTRLTVFVTGNGSDARLLTLPVDVHAPDGTLLARGTAAPGHPARFGLPGQRRAGDPDRVHVLGKLPNGAVVQQTAELGAEQASVTLHLGDESPHEWLQWVTPFHSLDHLRPECAPGAAPRRRIGKVWMTLWTLRDGQWRAEHIHPQDRRRDGGMQQFVIDVPRTSQLLQIGGEAVAWRLIALPPGGPVRVALTRSAAEDGDALEITVGRSEPDNELIMSYLARGAVAEADRLAQAWDAADLLLYERKHDPVSAAAGAYVLLKNHRLQQRRESVANLVDWFPYLADGAIVSAAMALQQEHAKESAVRAMIELALGRGLPVFAMGASLLVETMAAVHRGKRETQAFHSAYLGAQAYARARCSKGAYFAFYGKSPAEPSWTRLYGLEGDPAAAMTPGRPGAEATAATVVSAEPAGETPEGRFGRMRVELPRASVPSGAASDGRKAASSVDEAPATARSGRKPKWDGALFERIVDLGLARVDTELLRGIVSASVFGSSRAGRQKPARSRPKPLEQSSGKALEKGAKSLGKDWGEERLKHAVTVFDGDE